MMVMLGAIAFAGVVLGLATLRDRALRRRARRRWITDDAWQQLLRRARGGPVRG